MITLEEALKHEVGYTLVWARSYAGTTAVRVHKHELTYHEGIGCLMDYSRKSTTKAKDPYYVFQWMKQKYDATLSQIHKPSRKEVLASTLYRLDGPHTIVPEGPFPDTQGIHNVSWDNTLAEIKAKYRARAEECLKAIGE